MGLEPAWDSCRTLLVSDAGGKTPPVKRPWGFWPMQLIRVLHVVDNQVRSLRKRWLIERYTTRDREKAHLGAYWGIRAKIVNYRLGDTLECPYERTLRLAQTPTRLARTSDDLQEKLINWGYAVTDAAIRKHHDPDSSHPPPSGFPYPASGV